LIELCSFFIEFDCIFIVMIFIKFLCTFLRKSSSLRDTCNKREFVYGDARILKELMCAHIFDAVSSFKVIISLVTFFTRTALDAPQQCSYSPLIVLTKFIAISCLLKQFFGLIHPVLL